MRTKTFCEVSSLHPDDMEEVLRVHVKLRRRLERYGQLKQVRVFRPTLGLFLILKTATR